MYNLPKVRSLCSPKTGREVPNQFVIFIGDREYFQSYSSIIGYIDRSDKSGSVEIVLDENYWDYSRTTTKYRNEWLGWDTAKTRENIAKGVIKLANLN